MAAEGNKFAQILSGLGTGFRRCNAKNVKAVL
jgi:hypothetical protein